MFIILWGFDPTATGPFANVALAESVLLGDEYYGNAVTQQPGYEYKDRTLTKDGAVVARIIPMTQPEGDAEDQTGLVIRSTER